MNFIDNRSLEQVRTTNTRARRKNSSIIKSSLGRGTLPSADSRMREWEQQLSRAGQRPIQRRSPASSPLRLGPRAYTQPRGCQVPHAEYITVPLANDALGHRGKRGFSQ
jgi:hypothetical protein